MKGLSQPLRTLIGHSSSDQTPPIDFAAEYKLDRNGRLRYSSGAGRGQYAPRSATLALEARSIALAKAELQALGDRVSSGRLSLRDFQQEAGELLRQIHCSSAIVGRGGLDRMTSEDFLAIGRLLKVQYYDGKDAETDRRFGLKHLAAELKAGTVSPTMLSYRLGLYADSGKISFYEMERRSRQDEGKTEARRLLANADRSCPECTAYARMGWGAIDQAVLPTQKCSCRVRCRCQLEYR